MEHLKYFLLILAFFLFYFAYTQHVSIEQYHREDGLPNDLIKSFAIDSVGFIWVATDDGLVKIEGKNFVSVKTPTMFSNNFKNVLLSNKYGLIASADAGLLQVIDDYNGINSRYLSEIFPNAISPSLLYPKTIYESTTGEIWLADLKQVCKVDNGKFKVFNFPEKAYTDHFSRSFQFFEVGNKLYVISQSGFLYEYYQSENRFEPIEWEYNGEGIYDIYKINDNKFLVACEEGLIELGFNNNAVLEEFKRINLPYSVSVIRSFNSKLVIGSWSAGAYLNDSIANYSFKQIQGSENHVINDIIVDNNNQLWLGTDMGILLYRYSVFNEPFKEFAHNYIQDIRLGNFDNYYFSNGYNVYRIDSNGEAKEFYAPLNGLIISLEVDDKGVWLGSNTGVLVYKKFNGELNKYDFSLEGDGMYNLAIDKESNIWLIQSRPGKETLLKLDRNGKVSDFTPELLDGERVRSLKVGKSGALYLGATSCNNYLFKYNYKTSVFENISFPVELINNNTMSVNDIIELDKKHVLLATRLGLWELSNSGIKQLDLGDMSNEMVSALVADSEESFWFANSNGIVKYAPNNLTVFDNSDGLPAKTVNYRALVLNNSGELLAGTISGLAIGQVKTKELKTPCPIISTFEKTGLPATLYPNSFVQNSLLQFRFATPVYPAKYVHYQYNLSKNGEQSKWHSFKGYNDYLILNDLESGRYTLKVRSKNKGHFTWSNPVEYEFKIYKIWYHRPEILASIYFLVFLFVWIYTRYNNAKSEKEKKELEAIIAKRTVDLRDQNEELKMLNANLKVAKDQAEEAIATKDRFFSILAHDLKSPFNTIIGFSELLMDSREKLDNELTDKLFGELHKTSENTYKLLQNLLDWARSQTGGLKIQKVCVLLSEFVHETIPTLEAMATRKQIVLKSDIQSNATMFVDKDMLSTIVRNLVSNAIKYSQAGSYINLRVFQSDGISTLSVEDQGVGIAKDIVVKLFNLDSNTSTPGTGNEEGTGLGLVLCKEFVEKNGGEIKVESEINVGSKFIIELPSNKIDD